MKDKNIFPIRPRIEEGEALTSYLFRIAEANRTTFHQILQVIHNQKKEKITSREYRYLDLLPQCQADIYLLGNLLGMSEDEILSHTYYSAVEKISKISGEELDITLHQLSLLVETKKRLFCRKCLENKKGFSLIWQIKGLQICEIHKTNLESSCINCGKLQPYTRDQMKESCCVLCSYSLSYGSIDGKIAEEQETEYTHQLKKYKIWKQLLGNNCLSPQQSIRQFNLKQTLALKLIFLSQSKESRYRSNRVKYLTRGNIKILMRLIRGKRDKHYSIVGMLIRFFLNSNNSVEDLERVEVSQEYIQSILEDKPTKEHGPCLTPWCKYKNTNVHMTNHYFKASHTHREPSICTSCFIPYGYDRNSGNWCEIGNTINLVSNHFLLLLKSGVSRKRIQHILNISSQKVNDVIGYMYNQNLIPEGYKFVTRPKSESDLINKFKTLSEHVGGLFRFKMIPAAKKIFNWNVLEFHQYYYTFEIQMYWIHNKKKVERIPRYHKNLSKQIVEYRELCRQQGKSFSKKDFEQIYGVSRGVLKYHNLHDEATSARQLQNKSILSYQIQTCWFLARDYTEKLLREERAFNCQNVYSYIRRNRKWLTKNCPELGEWIQEQVVVSKEQQATKKLNEEKKKLKETIHYLFKHDINLSKSNLGKYSNINVGKLWGQTELGLFCDKTIEELVWETMPLKEVESEFSEDFIEQIYENN
ncbi:MULTISPECIES: TniQ family protein [unclassified Paenibacillus]|uniref:TniQ family protein n=1 Tax=unclassified Paenibacillus TaxID=185978 RepID=UPI001AEB059A|nr:TniQ family protein [Paenibacillus sp. PvR133]MBP1172882.1 hypothetical protein [Paenibacillus sp. PvR133]